MLELTLIRVLDVLWYPHMAYMVITLAMFCFGLAGIYGSLRPAKTGDETILRARLSFRAHFFALFSLAILPVINFIPFDFNRIAESPVSSLIYFSGIFITLGAPFFFAGLVITAIFSTYSKNIQSLYFWDLVGAAIGCVIIVPFLPKIGTGGLMFCASAFALWASGLFSPNRNWLKLSIIMGVAIFAIPFFIQPTGYLEFSEHSNKRGVKRLKESGLLEMSHWDPISKIDIIDVGRLKFLAYDRGTQSSYIYPFDGDLKKLRSEMPDNARRHFWGRHVFASHFLKRDSNYRALVIGSAGGQETKAALMFGAAHVDAVELVKLVVRLGKEDYAEYNGHIFNHPNVNVYAAEGRSFLRASNKKYDIIQIFSNHTSSSIAAGSGAMAPNYLQTAEAYQEYFEHLSENGILHINHHIYPRMITTAALAWNRMKKKDFQRHVMVFEAANVQDNLPTLLVKMRPWTTEEVQTMETFFKGNRTPVIHPLLPEKSYLTPMFFSGQFSSELKKKIPFNIFPATDDRPYFNFLRKKIAQLEVDPKTFVNLSTAGLLNAQLQGAFPMDIIHLLVTGLASLLFAVMFILVPLYFSESGKVHWPYKKSALGYFACLGAGFIIFELVLIQLFMKLIGYPLYTYSTIVFTLLFSAGCGSYASKKFSIDSTYRWHWPFWGILASGLFLLICHTLVIKLFLTLPVQIRIFAAFAMVFPLGFFMGIPFPLGILAIEKQPRGAIAWAWGVNALFTVIGGLLSGVLSIFIGFKLTIVAALGLYGSAFYLFRRIRFLT